MYIIIFVDFLLIIKRRKSQVGIYGLGKERDRSFWLFIFKTLFKVTKILYSASHLKNGSKALLFLL